MSLNGQSKLIFLSRPAISSQAVHSVEQLKSLKRLYLAMDHNDLVTSGVHGLPIEEQHRHQL